MNVVSIVFAAAASEVADKNGSNVFPPLDSSTYPSQLFWLAVTFGLLLFLLSKVLLPRLGSIIEERSDKIADDIDTAARMQHQAELAEKAYEKALADARAKANNVAESTRASVNADIEAEFNAAEKDAQESLDIADAKIKSMRDKALGNVDDIAASAVTAIVEKLYGGKVTAQTAKNAVSALN